MLISELGYGGAEGAFLRLARHLSRDASVEIAVFRERYASHHYGHHAEAIDIPVHRLDALEPEGRIRRWARRATRLRHLRERIVPTATISFLSGPNALNAISTGPGLRIVSVRGSRRFDAHAGSLSNRIQEATVDLLVCRRADAIVPVSRGLGGEIERSHRSARGKVHPIIGYVDAPRIIQDASLDVEPEFESLSGSPLLVAAGRFSPEKGFHHLLRVFAGVKRRRSKARLLLIGEGPDRNRLVELARALNLRASENPDDGAELILPGFRQRPHRYFRLARAFALTSASEGFPNILVEALATGTPVLAGDVPWGAREVLGLAPDPVGNPYPTTAATPTTYGDLLPPIDRPQFDGEWVDAICRSLDSPHPAQVNSAARERVAELDCASAARQWLSLIDLLSECANSGQRSVRRAR